MSKKRKKLTNKERKLIQHNHLFNLQSPVYQSGGMCRCGLLKNKYTLSLCLGKEMMQCRGNRKESTK